jgi:uncharacterized protein
MNSPSPSLPLPMITDLNRPYWEAANKGQLLVCTCGDCGRAELPPTQYCKECGSADHQWTKASGIGSIYTYTILHKAYHPALRDRTPYNVAIVELAEGPLIVSNVHGCRNEDLSVGLQVVADFTIENQGQVLPTFVPLRSSDRSRPA